MPALLHCNDTQNNKFMSLQNSGELSKKQVWICSRRSDPLGVERKCTAQNSKQVCSEGKTLLRTPCVVTHITYHVIGDDDFVWPVINHHWGVPNRFFVYTLLFSTIMYTVTDPTCNLSSTHNTQIKKSHAKKGSDLEKGKQHVPKSCVSGPPQKGGHGK